MNITDLLLKIVLGASGGNSMPNPVEISKQILSQVKKILKSLIILFICSVIFCLLMGYLVDRILNQMDLGSFVFTNSIVFLLVLIAINLVIIAWSLKKASAKEESAPRPEYNDMRSSDSPIETAIAALILDFIKERESARSKVSSVESGPDGL
jgi:F0F1-type ATP synthase assembly protein I